MRRTPIDPPRPSSLLAALAALAFVGSLPLVAARAQTGSTAKAAAPAPLPPIDGATLASRDKLVLFVEFDGLDAHEDAWRKTAAARMLNDTSLGKMLEEIGVPIMERLTTWLPNRKINGADAVAIVKHVARKGFVLTYNADPSAPKGVRGVLALRGAIFGKENKALFSRLIGSFMDPDAKPKVERKDARVLVSIPQGKGDGKAADQGWGWWPEKDDLIVGLFQPSDLDAVIGRLDGKTGNAVGHEPVASLSKPDVGVTPLLRAYYDPSARPGAVDPGYQRIEYRWGFQDEALVGVARIVAPKPRRGMLAFLDQPPTEAKNLLPVPDGVEYLASLSLKPEQWASMIATVFSTGSAKAQYDAIVESVKARGRIDFEKDLIGNLGPRAVFFLAPTTSAAAVEETRPGFPTDPAAILSAMGGRLPKPVIVAEIVDPAQFSRALDAVMLEANKQIKGVMAEQIAAAVKAEAAKGAASGRPEENEAAAERKERRREEAATPEFRLLPTSGGETSRIYMLNVATSSPVKLPSGFKPTIRVEGKFLVFSTWPETARDAMDAVKRKSWTPAGELAGAIAKAPDPAVALLYGDFRDATSGVLASLPGTLQTAVNSAIAASEALVNPKAVGGPGNPGGVGSGLPSGVSTEMDSSGMQQPGGGPQTEAAPAPGAAPAMLQLRVDPASLPKADELKALMFPSTTTVTVDDDSIRIVIRSAFPDSTAILGAKGVLPAMLAPAIANARLAAKAAAAKPAQAAEGTPGGSQPGQPGPGPAGP